MAQERSSKNSRRHGTLKQAHLRERYKVPNHIPDEQVERWVKEKKRRKEVMEVLMPISIKFLRRTYKVPNHIPKEQVRMWIIEKWKDYL